MRIFVYAAVLLPVLVTITARAQSFTPPTNVSNSGTGESPQVAVDSAGNVDIAYRNEPSIALQYQVAGVWFVRGTFDDVGFHPQATPVKVNQHVGGAFSMALEANCVIDIAYVEYGAPSASGVPNPLPDIYFAQSTDCRATFSHTNISNGVGFQPNAYADNEFITPQMIINNGVPQVAWQTNLPHGTGSTLYFAQRQPSGSFTTPTALTNASGINGLEIHGAGDGSADIAWEGAGVSFLNTAPGGQPTTFVANDPNDFDFVVDSRGDVDLVLENARNLGAEIDLARSTAPTGAFTSPMPRFIGLNPKIRVNSNGDLDVAWTEGCNPGSHGSQMVFSRSVDNGVTFSAPVTVGSECAGLPGTLLNPQIALDPSGFINLVWYQDDGMMFNRSNPQGTSFTAPLQLANRGLLPVITADIRGDAFAAWTDHDVFVTRITAPANFTISAAPGAQSLLPGGAGKFTVTLMATGGFSDAVNLTCSNLPSGAECAFNPSTITPNASGSQATLTVTTPPTLAQGTYSVSIAATASGGIQHTQDAQIVAGGISGSVTPSNMTIAVGSSANFTVSLHSSGGFSGPVNLACGGAPSGINCSFVPSQVSFAANGSASSALTVQVSAKPSISAVPDAAVPDAQRNTPPASPSIPSHAPQGTAGISRMAIFLLAILAAMLLRFALGDCARQYGRHYARRTRALAAAVLTIALAAVMLSCGGTTKSSSPSGTGTTIGTGATGGSGGSGGGTGGGGSSVTTQFMVQAQSGGATVNLGTVSVTVP